MAADDLDPIELLRADLKDDDYEQQINSVNKLTMIAMAIGPQRTRDELLPFLKDGDIDNDEALAAIATQLGEFVVLIGGPANAHILFPLLDQLASEEETVIRQAAVESTLKVLALTPPDDIHKKMFPIVKKLAGGEWFSTRVSSASLMAPVFRHIPEPDQTELLGWYNRLCNDEVPMVRKAAYENIGSVSRSLTKDQLKVYILPIVKALSEDHMDNMRIFTVDACTELTALLSPQESAELLLPLIDNFFEDSSWKVRQQVCKAMEDMCKNVGPQVASEKLLPLFSKLLQDGEVTVRLSAVKSLSKVSLAVRIGLLEHIAPHLESFTSDESDKVRVAFAQTISQLCQAFGQEQSLKLLVPLVLSLAKDENAEVRNFIISQLRQLSEALGKDALEEHVLPTVLELSKDAKWRVRMEVVGQCSLLAEQLGKETFERKFLDVLLVGLSDHVYSIREKSCEQVAQMVTLWGADWVTAKLFPPSLSLYERSSNYLHRMTALFIIKNVAALLDNRSVVEKQLLPVALKACRDEVANVRFVAAKTLSEVARNVDKQLIESQIKPALQQLVNDSDGDVQFFAEQALKKSSELC